jgi:hypothetical protein
MGGASLGDTPLLSALIGTGALSFALELWLLGIARRRLARSRELQRMLKGPALDGIDSPPSRLFELAVLLPPIATALVAARAIERSRSLMLRVLDHNADSAQLVASGLHGAWSATVIGASCTVPVLLLACWVSGLAASARLRADDSATAPSTQQVVTIALGFGGFGVLPVAGAAAIGALRALNALAIASTLEPSAQQATLAAAASTARAGLAVGFGLAVVGTLATSFAAWIWTSKDSRAEIWLSAAALGLALACSALSLPMKRENDLPWPPGSVNGLDITIATAQLVGPDPIPAGPVVEVGPASIKVDRAVLEAEALEPQFRELRQRFDVLHAGEAFPGTWLLACAPETPSARVFDAIGHIARAGYRKPTLIFEKQTTIVRPVLGQVPLHRVSGASATLLDGPSASENVAIGAHDVIRCGQLAERVVRARKQGSSVALQLPSPPLTAAP